MGRIGDAAGRLECSETYAPCGFRVGYERIFFAIHIKQPLSKSQRLDDSGFFCGNRWRLFFQREVES